jgi:drug/metabolite transporter (DMT)-like permease
LGFGYVSVVSMFLGFFAWYGGLAAGGVARISQLQLAQPVLTIFWSAALLGENISAYTLIAALLVLSSVAASQRTRVRGASPGSGKSC